MASNKAFIFKKVPEGWPVPGEHVAIETAPYDASVAAPKDGIVVQALYASLDPYMRGRMRNLGVKTYNEPFQLNKPIDTWTLAKVVRSDTPKFPEGEVLYGFLPMQEYIALEPDQLADLSPLENPLGIEDIRVFLGALGMTGLSVFISI